MQHFNYLIIGAGMTGDAAARGIRDVDLSGSIGLIGAEPDPPYNRPPLSKGLWKGDSIESIWRRMKKGAPELRLGRTARRLDPAPRRVADDRGEVYSYDQLLLATGGTPRRLAFGGDDVIYLRTVADYRRLRALADTGQRFGVIGGGFIGAEAAAALALNGNEVVLLFPDATLGARLFPADVGAFLNDLYRGHGVDLRPGTRVVGIERRGDRLTLEVESANGRAEIPVDGIVAGIGLQPNVELAAAAGLTIENGIWVDELLRTRAPDVYAAGDVAAFYNPVLGRRIRVEHEDNANRMGRQAGRNMAGSAERYHHLPSFYSDLFDVGYEAVGELDARLETVADWREPYRTGVIYYLADRRVRGVLLWNIGDQLDAARALLAEPGPFAPADLMGRI